MSPLPDKKQPGTGRSPLTARVMVVGTPKAGKTTLASGWAPDTTLLLDTQRGTDLLPGEHYVQHVNDWPEFQAAVDELTTTDHPFKTVVIDLIDDVWRFADSHFAGKGAVLASATDDWQRSIKTAEGMFTETVGKLLASNMGVWFLGHAREKQDGQITRYQAKLDARVLTYVQGASDFILLAEKLGPKHLLHTKPSAKFEAGTRVPLPEPLDLDARVLYAAMNKGLKDEAAKAAGKPAKKDEPVADAPAAETEPADAEKEMTTA